MIMKEISHKALMKATWWENLIRVLDYVEDGTKGDLEVFDYVNDNTDLN